MKKFAEAKIERPDEHFYGKTIDITGKVTMARLRLRGQQIERPQIVVNDLSQIKINEAKSGPPIFKRSHVYKHAGSVSLRADSYRFQDRQNQPVVVWIHGGALMLRKSRSRCRGGSWKRAERTVGSLFRSTIAWHRKRNCLISSPMWKTPFAGFARARFRNCFKPTHSASRLSAARPVAI